MRVVWWSCTRKGQSNTLSRCGDRKEDPTSLREKKKGHLGHELHNPINKNILNLLHLSNKSSWWYCFRELDYRVRIKLLGSQKENTGFT